jgi:hypothetical protein
MKQLIDLLEAKTAYCGDAKPCRIYINQAYRTGVVVSANDDFNVAYVMPNGRMYVKNVSPEQSGKILEIDWRKSFNEDGTTFSAFGF